MRGGFYVAFLLFVLGFISRESPVQPRQDKQLDGTFVTEHNNYILLSHHKQINGAPPLNFNEVKVSVKYEMRYKVESGVIMF